MCIFLVLPSFLAFLPLALHPHLHPRSPSPLSFQSYSPSSSSFPLKRLFLPLVVSSWFPLQPPRPFNIVHSQLLFPPSGMNTSWRCDCTAPVVYKQLKSCLHHRAGRGAPSSKFLEGALWAY